MLCRGENFLDGISALCENEVLDKGKKSIGFCSEQRSIP